MKRYASIDIGTNTILMVVADVSGDGTLKSVYDGQQLPRMGKDVDANRIISEEAIGRVVEALQIFKHKARELNASSIFACGTSALRDAKNRDTVVQIIREKTGIDVDIISGEQEAEYTYLGALSGLQSSSGYIGVLDIGGGSTELVVGKNSTMVSRRSINVGSVRLTEQFFPVLPPSEENMQTATEQITKSIGSEIQNYRIDKLIGVAGTVTTLAAIAKNLDTFSPELIDGYELPRSEIDHLFSKYSEYTLEEMKAIPQIVPGREDILLAGIIILKSHLSALNQRSIIVSTRGLRYGQILKKTAV